eukprot:1194571-Prorocentrum_minimum.AAC.2
MLETTPINLVVPCSRGCSPRNPSRSSAWGDPLPTEPELGQGGYVLCVVVTMCLRPETQTKNFVRRLRC